MTFKENNCPPTGSVPFYIAEEILCMEEARSDANCRSFPLYRSVSAPEPQSANIMRWNGRRGNQKQTQQQRHLLVMWATAAAVLLAVVDASAIVQDEPIIGE